MARRISQAARRGGRRVSGSGQPKAASMAPVVKQR